MRPAPLSFPSRGLFLLALGASLTSCKGDEGKSADPGGEGEEEVVDSALFTVAEGEVRCGSAAFRCGDSFLLPVGGAPVEAASRAVVLRTTLP